MHCICRKETMVFLGLQSINGHGTQKIYNFCQVLIVAKLIREYCRALCVDCRNGTKKQKNAHTF